MSGQQRESRSTRVPLLLTSARLFDSHRSRDYHPERPVRLAAARRALDLCRAEGVTFTEIVDRDATETELAAAHEPSYLHTLERLSGQYASLDADTYVAPASVAAAHRAAGCAAALVEALVAPPPSPGPSVAPCRGVALLRPPGHHASRKQGMGFCLLNNAAVAAYAALARGLERVAIIDWDVHHGNGTQDIFWEDPRVLYTSLHQFPFYPGTGEVTETGGGEGRGLTVNIPLSAGADDAVYAAAFDRIVLPVLDEFRPELVIVSAGFDAHERDPVGAMRLQAGAFHRMARGLGAIADRHASGRVAVLLEGGYDLTALRLSLGAALSAFAGSPPHLGESPPAGRLSPLSPEREAELNRARQAAAAYWHLT